MKKEDRARVGKAIGLAAAIAALGWGAHPASALCPSNVTLQVGDRTIDFELDTDVPGAGTKLRVKLGLAAGVLDLQSRVIGLNNASRPNRFQSLTGLAPSTTYYFDPQVSDVGALNWSDAGACQAQICPSAGTQPGGYVCEDIGAGQLRPKVTTLALDAPAQRLPAPPSHEIDPTAIPAVTGSTFPVLVDANWLCTNLQAQLQACAAANPNQTHEVLIPAGATCRAGDGGTSRV